ncbi:MAG: prolyl oligopeptidase family serine peptidase [Acidobacteria bacterium]|jgi:esterase/lipase superfamily enzyme|nr:prolyl oligopeptidase family serine peptidase [Acidobacteriota bacterium]
MQIEHHGWHSGRLGRGLGVRVYGHYGSPILVFPTSGGDEWEYERQGMIETLGHHVDAGRIKLFCVGSVNNDGWLNDAAHPRHRSYVQAMYDAYIAEEVVPFVHGHCRSPGIAITTTGASFGAYHAANSLLKHPHLFRRCLALSGVYDLRRYMGGDYDDNFYFNNPVDYVPGISDPWALGELARDDIRLATGTGPWEDAGPTYRMSEVLSARGIRHSVDDWGPDGGHDWPFWKRQMNEYVSRLF